MASEPRGESRMETDYSKHTHFRWINGAFGRARNVAKKAQKKFQWDTNL